jgi:hypothetical protein
MRTESRGRSGKWKEFSMQVDVNEELRELKLKFRKETEGEYCRILDTCHHKDKNV